MNSDVDSEDEDLSIDFSFTSALTFLPSTTSPNQSYNLSETKSTSPSNQSCNLSETKSTSPNESCNLSETNSISPSNQSCNISEISATITHITSPATNNCNDSNPYIPVQLSTPQHNSAYALDNSTQQQTFDSDSSLMPSNNDDSFYSLDMESQKFYPLDQHPSLSTQNPTLTTQNPTISIQNPTLSIQNPPISIQSTPLTSQNPSITIQNPLLSTQNPSISIQNASLTTTNPQPSPKPISDTASKQKSSKQNLQSDNKVEYISVVYSDHKVLSHNMLNSHLNQSYQVM